MIIFITPEYLTKCEIFIKDLCLNKSLLLIAIDEAHCISTWGNDFRESYKELKQIREWTDVPILALTATASSKVRNDICIGLNLKDPLKIIGSFDRPNLFLSVIKKKSDFISDINHLLEEYKNEHMIIYCRKKSETHDVAEKIKEIGINCEAYNAGLDPEIRNRVQEDFTSGKCKCIVATIAFGMGINVPNIRLIIHNGCPKNLESYYQEIGRAGRDGLPSECLIVYKSQDFVLNNIFASKCGNSREQAYQREQNSKIEKYIYGNGCRRKLLLNFFGELYKKDKCDFCDNCKKNIELSMHDYTKQAFMILSQLSNIKKNYGKSIHIEILRGSKSKKIEMEIRKLIFYGAGKEYTKDWWDEFIKLLCHEKYIDQIQFKFKSPYTIIKCGQKGTEWLKKVKPFIKSNIELASDNIHKIEFDREIKNKTKKQVIDETSQSSK